MDPSQMLHGGTAAYRADTDINTPYGFQQFRHGHPGILPPELLPPLQPEDKPEVRGFCPVIQEAVIPDPLEAFWKHMHQETADEFRIAEGDRPARFPRFLSPGGERGLCFRHGEDAAVGDGDPVRITAEVFNGISKPVECFLYIRAPVPAIKAVLKLFPCVRIPEILTGGSKAELSRFVKGVKTGKVLSLKLVTQDAYGDKELLFCRTYLMVCGKAAAGNDTVHMHMVGKFLVPGVEDLDDARGRAEIFFIRG